MYSLARFNLENDFRQCILLNSYPSQTHALKENFARATKHFSLDTKSPRKLVVENGNSIYLGMLAHCKKEGFQKKMKKKKKNETSKKKNQSSEVKKTSIVINHLKPLTILYQCHLKI